jgi:hypothetical protein
MPTGIVTIDFGAIPTDEANVVVTGLADMTTSMHVEVFFQADDSTADNNADAHDSISYFSTKPVATTRVAGTGFTAVVRLWAGEAFGTYKLHYVYAA